MNNLTLNQIRALNEARTPGAQPTMFVQNFGCQMNDRESEKLRGLLLAMGYAPAADEETADLVLYNTCCVREAAEQKVYGKLGFLKSYKAKQPGKVLVLCGCMPQRPEVMAALQRHHRHLDVIFGTFNKHRFPQLLLAHLQQKAPIIEVWDSHAKTEDERAGLEDFEGQTARVSPHKAGITVMYGCDNFCSYCIVPHVRGREKSRPPQEILAEAQAYAADGVREIMLLGQNVNSYGNGLADPCSFASLLRTLNAVPGLRRIRFMTSHPKDLSEDLMEALRDCDTVCKHIHLPLQSGSAAVLQRMNRGYTPAAYLDLVRRLRAAVPGIAITTDIIVGFPGETEADFEDTLTAARQADFAGAFTFLYSPREGTPAAAFDGEVPKEIANARFQRLLDVVNPSQLAYNRRFLGRRLAVLADGPSGAANPQRFTGRTDENVLVHFDVPEGMPVQPGDFVTVAITDCKTFYISGDMV